MASFARKPRCNNDGTSFRAFPAPAQWPVWHWGWKIGADKCRRLPTGRRNPPSRPQERGHMNTDPMSAPRMPYPMWTYAARAAWVAVQATLWKLAWSKLDFLRPAILKT